MRIAQTIPKIMIELIIIFVSLYLGYRLFGKDGERFFY
nr:MAG TPA: Geminivirus putative movement protein [Caudoviricetes sp.]